MFGVVCIADVFSQLSGDGTDDMTCSLDKPTQRLAKQIHFTEK